MVKNHALAAVLFVNDFLHLILEQALGLDLEPGAGEKQGSLVAAQHVIHLGVIRQGGDQLHGKLFRVIQKDVEGVRHLRGTLGEKEFAARAHAAGGKLQIKRLDNAGHAVDEQVT